MEKHDEKDLERQAAPSGGRITYGEDVRGDRVPRERERAQSRSRRSMSIHSARRTVDPAVALPPVFRTKSFEIAEGQRRASTFDVAREKDKDKTATIDFNDLDYHLASPEELLSRLSSSRTSGLSDGQVAEQLKTVGPNVPTPPPSQWFRKTVGYLYGGFGAILFVASILVFVAWKPLGQPPSPANLALAIVLVFVWVAQAAFSFWQDFSSSRVMASITTMLPDRVFVLRNGSEQEVDGRDIVPGDILHIKMGNKLPADVRFIAASSDARFDRSILTGETIPLLASVDSTDKNYLETACIGMAGTHCVAGSCWGLVVETGDRTIFGRIAKLTSAPKPGLTPLQKEILYFVLLIVGLMMTFIILFVIVWAAWLRKVHPDWISVPSLIVDCVSVAVAFIPEGLPIAITASLTITAGIMKKNKVLCKSLKTVETLGSVNVICSDKTGTLTRNQMSVTDFYLGLEAKSISKETFHLDSSKALNRLHALSSVCNDAEFDASTVNKSIADRKVNGDATDTAILRFAEKISPVQAIRNSWHSIFKVAFNSKNKFALNVTKLPESDGTLLMAKGAPDILLPRCITYLDNEGQVQTLTDAERERIEAQKNTWSAQGRRVILLSQKPLENLIFHPTEQPREYERDIMGRAAHELTFVGLIAIVDPPRPEIPTVVQTLRGAGVRIFMVTGDFKLTAQAIAAECGIITVPQSEVDDVTNLAFDDEYLDRAGIEKSEHSSVDSARTRAIVLTGADVETLDDVQWNKLVKYDEIVFSRTTPEHKLRIVKELQAREFTVGMTGDGVNDAPSLKAADVGIAMGSGSDVAIEAADMVLLDSFAAVVEAVRYGRVVYDNLRKTICYLLPAGSFSEFWPVFTNVIFGIPQILSSFLMIIVCCFTDCAAATALAYEAPEADVLLRAPRNPRKDRLVDWKLLLQAYGFIGFIESISSFAMAYWYAQRHGVTFGSMWFSFQTPTNISADEYNNVMNIASSIYFVNLVVMQWFNIFAIRTRRRSVLNQKLNMYIFPAILFALLISIFFLYLPKFHEVLSTAPAPVEFWFFPMAFGLGWVLIDEGRKYVVRNYPKSFIAKIAW